MGLLTTRPRGTEDVLPQDSAAWQFLTARVRDHCTRFNYHEIRTPTFEHTELYHRGVGETTDIVEKEMYTFKDRGGRDITLRPEGTASVVRAFLENSLGQGGLPVRVFYIEPMFRYERPQGGRLREHTQFGVELIGAEGPMADAEVIELGYEFLAGLGLKNIEVQLNSIGCPTCRPRYREALVDYLRGHVEELCEDCQARLERNPLRVLDCKREGCRAVTAGAPRSTDHLCDDCRAHFNSLQDMLTTLGIPFTLNPRLVRGLDYYTRTVFEMVHGGLGAQNAVCSGGRYDGLAEELGGPHTPGIGFGLGIERLILTLRSEGIALPEPAAPGVLVAVAGEGAAANTLRRQAMALARNLRRAGLSVTVDVMERSLKAQLRYANKEGVRYVAVLGEEETAAGEVTVRDMNAGTQERVPVGGLVERLSGRTA